MAVVNLGYSPKVFQEIMGRGGAVPFGMRQGQPETKPSEQQAPRVGTEDSTSTSEQQDKSNLPPTSPSETKQPRTPEDQALLDGILERFGKGMPVS